MLHGARAVQHLRTLPLRVPDLDYMVAGDASNDGFAFPDLPKPKPLPARVRGAGRGATRSLARPDTPDPDSAPACPQNPLLERSTVTDSSAGSLAAPSAVGVPASGAAGRPRKKLPFQIGCSPMDWLRLSRSKADLSGGAAVGCLRCASEQAGRP